MACSFGPAVSGGLKRRCRFCIPMVVPDDLAYDIWKRLTPDMVALGHGLGCNRWGDKQYKARNVRGCRPLQRAEKVELNELERDYSATLISLAF